MSNTGGLYTWSQTPANNATADNQVNFQEGQSPSSLNDSCRGLMSSAAKYRDDISGSILTGGTSTAYIVSSNQDFDTLADFNGKLIAFTMHATNGAGPVTMTVDGFANLPLRTSPNTELLPGVLIQGTPYAAIYNNTDGALYLQGYFGQQNIPIGASIDYWSNTAPFSNYAFMFGQAISRTAFARLFTLFGTGYGAGDGSTTFNIPDLRGRVVAGVDNMGGSAAGRLTTASGMGTGQLSQVGGGETQSLTIAEIPTVTGLNNNTVGLSVGSPGNVITGGITASAAGAGAGITVLTGAASGAVTSTGSIAPGGIGFVSANTGGSAPVHPNVQPTICGNKLLRVL